MLTSNLLHYHARMYVLRARTAGTYRCSRPQRLLASRRHQKQDKHFGFIIYFTQMRNTHSHFVGNNHIRKRASASDRRLTPRTFAPNITRLAATHERYVVCHHSHPCPGWHTSSHFAQAAWPATRVALRVVDVLILCSGLKTIVPFGGTFGARQLPLY